MKRGVVGLVGVFLVGLIGMMYFSYMAGYSFYGNGITGALTANSKYTYALINTEKVTPKIIVVNPVIEPGQQQVLNFEGTFNKNVKVYKTNAAGHKTTRKAVLNICFFKSSNTETTKISGRADYDRALPKCNPEEIAFSTVEYDPGIYLIVGEGYGINQRRYPITATFEVS